MRHSVRLPFVKHTLFVLSMILSSSAVIYLVMMFVRIKQCGFNFRNFSKPRTSSEPVISFAPCTCFTNLYCIKRPVLRLCCPVVVCSFVFSANILRIPSFKISSNLIGNELSPRNDIIGKFVRRKVGLQFLCFPQEDILTAI